MRLPFYFCLLNFTSMQTEISRIIEQLKETYEGNPWFGRSAKALLSEVDEETALINLNRQHNIVELLWHMVNWREFVISHLAPSGKKLAWFEEHDWQELNKENRQLWHEGLQRLQQTQETLLQLLTQKNDSLLEKNVSERKYNYRTLLNGIIQHDVYHLGQIAFIAKALRLQ